ncbi:MAG: hypothetical protein OXB88_09480 [Bacteriovoracales bacterium]|nr:hypothetical protein [Bacteriovoracales bacterium]
MSKRHPFVSLALLTLFTIPTTLTILLPTTAYGAYFTKEAPEWDENCPFWHIDRFRNVSSYFTLGVKGATHFGFDYEAPIRRKEVDILHCALDFETYTRSDFCRDHVQFGGDRPFLGYDDFEADETLRDRYAHLEEQLGAYYFFILEWLEMERPYDFNVGAVLEYLSRLYLQELEKVFPFPDYFITGGVFYYDYQGGKRLGELDVIVYDPNSCDVVAIAETKVAAKGSMDRALKKAWAQLARIRGFLEHHLFEGEGLREGSFF